MLKKEEINYLLLGAGTEMVIGRADFSMHEVHDRQDRKGKIDVPDRYIVVCRALTGHKHGNTFTNPLINDAVEIKNINNSHSEEQIK